MFRIVLLVQLPFDGIYFGECISRSDCKAVCFAKVNGDKNIPAGPAVGVQQMMSQ
jgi:hypothetical protein